MGAGWSEGSEAGWPLGGAWGHLARAAGKTPPQISGIFLRDPYLLVRNEGSFAMGVDWGIVLTVFFGVLSVVFGLQTWRQSIERREQQRAIEVFSQGLYNNLWRMGAGGEKLLGCDDLNEAKRIAYGISEVSQGARNFVISFGKQYAEFVPYAEAAWEPKPLPPKLRPFWRRAFSSSAVIEKKAAGDR